MSDRIIRLASDNFTEDFKSLFPEVLVFDKERDKDLRIDLLIFPGGEDIQPSYYMNSRDAARFADMVYTNPARDEEERDVFRMFLDGALSVNKVLGVCRGLQFINVMLGGTLYHDLPSAGKGHRGYHQISHHKTHPLNYLTSVNSLHHQGLRNFGYYDSHTGNEYEIRIISVEPNSSIPEIVTWNRGKILGVQFHPEFWMDGSEVKDKFISIMDNWISK